MNCLLNLILQSWSRNASQEWSKTSETYQILWDLISCAACQFRNSSSCSVQMSCTSRKSLNWLTLLRNVFFTTKRKERNFQSILKKALVPKSGVDSPTLKRKHEKIYTTKRSNQSQILLLIKRRRILKCTMHSLKNKRLRKPSSYWIFIREI